MLEIIWYQLIKNKKYPKYLDCVLNTKGNINTEKRKFRKIANNYAIDNNKELNIKYYLLIRQ